MRLNGLIPARFMLLIAHLVLAIILFSSIEENIVACLPEGSTITDAKRTEFIVGLALTIGLISIELLGFISGVSMFMPTQDMISIFAHCSGTVALAFFIFEAWPCTTFWWIFGFCSVFPAFTEILSILGFVLNWNL